MTGWISATFKQEMFLIPCDVYKKPRCLCMNTFMHNKYPKV